MHFRHTSNSVLIASMIGACATLLGLVSTADAEFLGPTITVTATNDLGTASMEWNVETLPEEGSERVRFGLAERVTLRSDQGTTIATINDLGAFLDGDPVVDLDFSVTAGNTPTTFTITSAMVGFDPINNPFAFATAAVTVTDGNPLPGNGASLAPNSLPNIYQARYNGGSDYADLIGSVNFAGPGSSSMSAFEGINTIAGAVSSIQAEFNFTLSANDLASGTSHYEISVVPEPATAGLMLVGLIGLLAARRRS